MPAHFHIIFMALVEQSRKNLSTTVLLLLWSIYGSYFVAIDRPSEKSFWVAYKSDFPPAA